LRSISREIALSRNIVTVLALPALPFIMAGTPAAELVGLIRTSISQGIGWVVWVPFSYLIGLVEAAPGWRLKVEGCLMRPTGVENIYKTDRRGNGEFVTNGRDLWVNTYR
tara:strand:+ start:124 stop:453 length:330 start_codon:yes stop_codon:yes gene_type:complete